MMWTLWKSGHCGQNDPGRYWTSGQILPSVVFWFILRVAAELPYMTVCSRVNFQIPKYSEIKNSRSKLGFPVRYCMLQDILVTCLLVISKEVQLRFWEWLCIQQWAQCVVSVAVPCVPCLDSHCSGWQCQGKNDKTILPLFSLHLHADVKGPAIIIKASWSRAFSLEDA